MRTPARAVALAGLALLSGCATDDLAWFATQGVGQAEVLLAARSARRLREDPETPAAIQRRLALVQAAKSFARYDLGLTVKQQYRAVTFLDAPAVVYVVSASPRTALESHTWDYPVVGSLPYRGHFSLEDAEAEADDLEAEGLDVDVRPVTTYSLLGILPDPIVSPMLLGSDELRLVETVVHELAHATVFAPGEGAFNEGLATFIGREGRRRFVEKHYGTDSAIYRYMLARDADVDAYIKALGALAFDLRVLFAQAEGLTSDELLRRRDAIFLSHQRHYADEVVPVMQTYRLRRLRLPSNNAELAAYGIYTLEQHLYRRAFRACNEDLRCLIRDLKAAAASGDPEDALERRVQRAVRTERILP
jgi:predicted aminopeptidase